MIHQWSDCDRNYVSRRYDRVAKFVPLFDRLLFLPRNLRAGAVAHLGLRRGDSVLDLGCGTGASFQSLYNAVGPTGHIYGVDISPGMLRIAKRRCDTNGWLNIELSECDAADYVPPKPLDGVLISLTYNTIPHHRAVLRHVWRQLRPGGFLVIMDARLPPGLGERLLLPFSLWLMRRTMLGNPLIKPWQELAALSSRFDMSARLFGSYYICRGIKPPAEAHAVAGPVQMAPEFQIAAE